MLTIIASTPWGSFHSVTRFTNTTECVQYRNYKLNAVNIIMTCCKESRPFRFAQQSETVHPRNDVSPLLKRDLRYFIHTSNHTYTFMMIVRIVTLAPSKYTARFVCTVFSNAPIFSNTYLCGCETIVPRNGNSRRFLSLHSLLSNSRGHSTPSLALHLHTVRSQFH